MATDFFQRQSEARRSTGWLVVMFALAVVGVVGTVTALTTIAVSYSRAPYRGLRAEAEPDDRPNANRVVIPAAAAAITLLLIAGGSLFKMAQLRQGGGASVAEQLGGRRLYPNSDKPYERRLLNIVEEMAIASGTPAPPVFLLDQEEAINAFAAGYFPTDAVLGITRGCAEKLSRDELQGVVAHEFSHIFNGDMRMNIRLMGVLNGILLLGLVGQLVFRMIAYSGSGRSYRGSSKSERGSGQIMLLLIAISIVLIVVGFIGTFFGNLIKAAVSRQREYLADASAVQFTRNPSGIANALRKIGAVARGSRLRAPRAAEASHMYFAKGVWEGFSGLWATHPPLEKRIRALDPQWDGTFPKLSPDAGMVTSDLAMGLVGGQAAVASEDQEVPLELVDHAVDYVGEPTVDHREYARRWLAAVPPAVLAATRDPYGSRAVTFCLLMDHDPRKRQRQQAMLNELAAPDLMRVTLQLLPSIDQLDARTRLPLVDLALPSLRTMSASQYRDFAKCFDALVRADHQLDLFEWILSQVLARHLRPQFEQVKTPPVRYYALHRLAEACAVLISAVAYSGEPAGGAEVAFAAARPLLPELDLNLVSPEACGLGPLRKALRQLNTVSIKHRGRLVDACAACICADQHVRWREAELLRGISDLLGCPMPPLTAPQSSYDAPSGAL